MVVVGGRRRGRTAVLALAATAAIAAGCRGAATSASTDAALGSGSDGAAAGDARAAATARAPEAPPLAAHAIDEGCPSIFTQDALRRYDLEIAADVWRRLMADFAAGPPPATAPSRYYPVTRLSLDGETRTDALIRLKGDR